MHLPWRRRRLRRRLLRRAGRRAVSLAVEPALLDDPARLRALLAALAAERERPLGLRLRSVRWPSPSPRRIWRT